MPIIKIYKLMLLIIINIAIVNYHKMIFINHDQYEDIDRDHMVWSLLFAING